MKYASICLLILFLSSSVLAEENAIQTDELTQNNTAEQEMEQIDNAQNSIEQNNINSANANAVVKNITDSEAAAIIIKQNNGKSFCDDEGVKKAVEELRVYNPKCLKNWKPREPDCMYIRLLLDKNGKINPEKDFKGTHTTNIQLK